jgi:hypothetical protein
MAVMAYRTRDGLADYGFSIDYQPGMGWRVFIVFRPFHQSQDGGLLLPYQALDANNRYYVDWSEKLDSLGDAKTVAALWAELAQGYQRDQDEKARYEELIERFRRDYERKRATSAGLDRLSGSESEGGGAQRAGEPGPGPAVIPHPRVSAESFTTLPESA